MPTFDVPFYGTIVLCLALVSAAYTVAVSIGAGRGRPQLLVSSRWGAYATCALVGSALLILAYAFQTHDFRISYVAKTSDRSMPWYYLWTSLWGGQDGSLLWWSFLLCGWIGSCVFWMKGRYAELQPWVIATLMGIVMFFLIAMLWSANPFRVTPGLLPADGQGMNPLLQNYWMIIHPPTLYMGFIGWSIPFAFCIAALITGRVHDEWLIAMRRWAMAAWLFLSIGLLLGALWSYEELGWGGYWAWDPVENASFMPWLVGTAFIHSVIVQERYGMLKVWNVFLICLTFFMTIFGTFLTRSGMIASVHSFAKSEIGTYFMWFMGLMIIACFALIAYRLKDLKAVHRIESLMSREFAFLLNNWILLAIMASVLVLTTLPLVSELLFNEERTVGPPVYNAWLIPFGIVLLILAGVGPLISWRKATGKNLAHAFTIPTATALIAGVLHLLIGDWMGLPAYMPSERIYDTQTGEVLQAISGVFPLLSIVACAFVTSTILQEFWRGTRVRMKNKDEGFFVALFNLVARARRRYGGYIVHLSAVLMYIGFTGAAYDQEAEAALMPGETFDVGDYEVRYDRVRVEEDTNKRMLFADVTILDEDGDEMATVSPAKWIYSTHPEMPTTEVAIRSRLAEDLYVILASVNTRTGSATFRAIVRPLVIWIWIGALLMIFGTFIGVMPSAAEIAEAQKRRNSGAKGARARNAAKKAAGAALFLLFGALAGMPATAEAQDSSSAHAGTIIIDDPDERLLFDRLLCMCGDCSRLTLANCGCGWAEDKRAELRGEMANGATPSEIQNSYRAEYGEKSMAIPRDEGLGRAMWAVPLAGTVIGAGAVLFLGLSWRKRSSERGLANPASSGTAKEQARDAAERTAYDDQIDAELDAMEDEV